MTGTPSEQHRAQPRLRRLRHVVLACCSAERISSRGTDLANIAGIMDGILPTAELD